MAASSGSCGAFRTGGARGQLLQALARLVVGDDEPAVADIDAVGARSQREGPGRSGQHHLAADLGQRPGDAGPAAGLRLGEPGGEARQPRHPEGRNARIAGVVGEHRPRRPSSAPRRCRRAACSGKRCAKRPSASCTIWPRSAGPGRSPSSGSGSRPQDAVGKDRIGVGDPGLDGGHAELARPRCHRRPRLGRAHRPHRAGDARCAPAPTPATAAPPRATAPCRPPAPAAAAASATARSARRRPWRRASAPRARRRAAMRSRARRRRCAPPARRGPASRASAG